MINAPIGDIDIPSCCFALPESEYQSCSPAHCSTGATTSSDGRRMSDKCRNTRRKSDGELLRRAHAAIEINLPNYVASKCTLRIQNSRAEQE